MGNTLDSVACFGKRERNESNLLRVAKLSQFRKRMIENTLKRRNSSRLLEHHARRTSTLKQLTQSADIDTTVRLPIVGILQGRMTRERLGELWDSHGTENRETLTRIQLESVMRDIIVDLPQILEQAVRVAIQPMFELAHACEDSQLLEDADSVQSRIDEDFVPVLSELRSTISQMDERRMRQLVNTLIQLMDPNNSNDVSRENFIEIFNPRRTPPPTTTKHVE